VNSDGRPTSIDYIVPLKIIIYLKIDTAMHMPLTYVIPAANVTAYYSLSII